MSATPDREKSLSFLAGGGEVGRLMRDYDWSISPLGPAERWPQPLKTLVEVMLAANQPMFVAWGSERTLLYNNPYVDVLADKHPALGKDFLEVWHEVRADLTPLVERAYGGEPSHSEDITLFMERKGYREEAHFAYSYTPVRDETGTVAGFFCPFIETTEQVLAERRLRGERERQRRMLQQMPGFVALLSGPEHRFEYVNDAYIAISGPREFIGRTVREVFPDIAEQGFYERLDQVYATGERFEARAIAVQLQGEADARCIDLLYEAIRDDDGAVTGIFVGGYDVSERARAERTLRASEARFRGVLDGMAEGFGLMAPDYTILELNDEAMRLETRSREEIIGKTHWQAYPGSEHSEIGQLYKRAMTERVSVALEHRYAWEDGRVAWLDMRAYPTADGGLAIFYRDVTDRKLADSELRDTEERLRLAVDNAEIGFWDVDEVNDLLIWPGRTKAMFGISPDVPVSMQDFYEGLHPDDREATSMAYAAAADPARRALYDVEYRTIGKEDGVVRWVAAKGRGVFDETGRCLRVAGTAIDITARKTAEARLRQSEARHRFRVELGDAIRSMTDPSAIMGAVAGRLGAHLGVDQANYYRIDGDRFVVTEEWRTPASPGVVGSHALAGFGESMIKRLREADNFIRLDDTRGEPGADAFAAAGMGAVLSASLRSGGRWAGGLHLHSATPRAWTDEEAALVRDTADRAWGAVQRARAEAELRASEEFNRRILASSADCIKVLDLDARLDFMSEGGMCIMEVDDFDAIAGAYWPDFWKGEEHDKALAAIEEARRGGTGRFRGFATTMKGSPRWWDVAVTSISGADGRPEKLLSVSRDITQQHAAEERLRELNETLEAQVAERTADRDRLWKNSQDLLMIARFDTTIVTINPSWAESLGWSEADMIGASFTTFIHPDDLPTARIQAERLTAGGDATAQFEIRYRAKSGDWVSLAWSVSSSAGHFHGIARDVTAERIREAELETAQEALRQSQKMESMGQLTGGVAHDFNNLLTPIIGSLDMLVRKGVGSERERRLIDGALQSAERAKTLVQRLLAFARRQPLQPIAVDVGRLVDGMANLVGSTLGPTIDVRVDLEPDLPPAKADPNQLEMALLNLAVNARDAMPSGGELTIAAKCEAVRGVHKSGLKPGAYVRLSVSDTGSGMDQETIARAIEPFFSTKGIGKGTGLGLSMVHGLTAQLGGGLTIDSALGQGTTISLWLPVSVALAEGEEIIAAAPPARVGRGTAILVDDEELVRMSTADMLLDLGFEVIEAGSADEALRIMRQGMVPNLLVTDHLMPGMSGAELAREARTFQPSLPILVVSGYAEVEGLASEWPRLTKPFRNADLSASIAALFPTAQ